MIRPILLYGHPALTKKSENFVIPKNMYDIQHFKHEIDQYKQDMLETMRRADGCGLALPQIGINKNLLVIEDPKEKFVGTFMNINILKYYGYMSESNEGCLSFPGISVSVVRPFGIEAEYYDENLVYHKEKFTSIKSRILQHETDHLRGILFIDRATDLERMKLFYELEHIKDKKVKISYLYA